MNMTTSTSVSFWTLVPANLHMSNDTPSCRGRLPGYTLALTGTSCSLSILGAIVIFITYFTIPEIRSITRKMLLWLTLADLFTALGNLLGTIRYAFVSDLRCNDHGREYHSGIHEVCIVQSVITTASSMASFLWTLAIALHIFMSVTCRCNLASSRVIYRMYHVICWLIPVSITLTAAFLGYLGEDHSIGTGTWCWIRSSLSRHRQITWMLLSGKGWEMSCYIATASLYIILKLMVWIKRRQQRRITDLGEYEGLRDQDEKFLYVWLILYLIRVWGTVRFWIWMTRNDAPHRNVKLETVQFVLLNLQGIGDSAQAFCNCIVFCLCDKEVRQRFCRRNNSTEMETLLNRSQSLDTEGYHSIT